MSKEDTGGGGIMDINKCADCYTVYCSFSESDRQKLEMFDEMFELLLHLRDDPFGMGSCLVLIEK